MWERARSKSGAAAAMLNKKAEESGLKAKAGAAAAMASKKADQYGVSDKLADAKATAGAKAKELDQKYSVKQKAAMAAGAAAAAAGTVASGMMSRFSPDFQAFVKNPSVEGLQANPELMLSCVSLLTMVRHPKAAVFEAAVATGMGAAKAHGQQATQQMAGHAAAGAVNASIKESTGINANVSAETARKVMDQMEPAQMVEVVKIIKMLKGL